MKKIITLLAVVAAASVVYASEPAAPELRPAQKVMQARAGWMKAMGENLVAKKFEDVAKDSEKLAVQTRKIGENHPNPTAKELTMKVSGLATGVAESAAKKDESGVKAKMGEIKATCAECHAKIRDKK